MESNIHPCDGKPKYSGLKTWPPLPPFKRNFTFLSISTFLVWQKLSYTSYPLLLTTSSWLTLNAVKETRLTKRKIHILRKTIMFKLLLANSCLIVFFLSLSSLWIIRPLIMVWKKCYFPCIFIYSPLFLFLAPIPADGKKQHFKIFQVFQALHMEIKEL